MSRYGSAVAGVVVPAAPTPAQATLWAGSHQAPILDAARLALARDLQLAFRKRGQLVQPLAFFAMVTIDRKSTRLNSSHLVISYAVFCLKKKKTEAQDRTQISAHTT